MNNKKLIIILCGIVVLLGFSFGVYGHLNKKNEAVARLAQENNSVFNRSHAPIYGAPEAKVRIVEFFDPACETCRAFYPLVKRIVDGYPGKVQLVVRLVPFHKGSDEAARILIAAHRQNLFFPVTEVVLNSQDAWAAHDNPNPGRIWAFLKGTSLDAAKARQDTGSLEARAVLDQDMADAATLQVTRTPGFFVNGRPLTTFGHEPLKAMVDEEVKRAYPQ
ncbi:Protein-disulfide isomerase [Polaromonas sp. YR568]|uniref:DsbA family protein n=1 Tax=Polaromonas sp. YR568 TaxID=1855301 RepID=UPI0008ED456C|nr:thioredoxin domain-containing protein [Polaromonas sp. YR568]SFU85839.1 Protein-disulfide isomerase [Polaromonas sp. YR568]